MLLLPLHDPSPGTSAKTTTDGDAGDTQPGPPPPGWDDPSTGERRPRNHEEVTAIES
jgi:hypothetical protein